MSLLTLPTEVVHRVFDYCDAQTTLFSVRCVCKRLNEIVNIYDRVHLIFNSKSSYSVATMSRFLQSENVVSLVLENDYQPNGSIKLFISLFAIDRFTRLRSLTLYHIRDNDLKHILEHMNMNQITSLSIHSCEGQYNKTWTIVSPALLQYNLEKLSMSNINYRLEHVIWPDQYKLSYLAIQDCTFNEYLAILRQLPNLRTLVMRQCSFTSPNNTLLLSSTPLLHSSLTSLTVSDYSISLQNLAPLVSPIPSLQHLKLISYRKTMDYVFNGSIWQDFIVTKMPELERFEFFFSYTYSQDQNFASLESIMQPFRAPFYLDGKRWFVNCVYVPRFRAIWLYTIPICSIDCISPLRCEVSWTGNTCRLTQRPINETCDTTADEAPFSILDVAGNGIGDEGVRHLADALRDNMTITSLDLHDNRVQDRGVEYLATALRHNKTLTTLNLLRNVIRDQGVQHLARVLHHNETLTSLNLIRNRIANQGAGYLAHALRRNKTLTTLHLWNNEIGDEGAQNLSVALRHNMTLKLLDLGGNQIGEKGAMQLADALQYNKILKELWLWNNKISSELKQHLQKQDSRIEC